MCDVDLNSFRAALATLQAQVNDLDKLKSDYYQQVLEHEQHIWDGVLGNVCPPSLRLSRLTH
jgi:uncharacterized protein YlxW (UPF0749 family)